MVAEFMANLLAGIVTVLAAVVVLFAAWIVYRTTALVAAETLYRAGKIKKARSTGRLARRRNVKYYTGPWDDPNWEEKFGDDFVDFWKTISILGLILFALAAIGQVARAFGVVPI